MLPLWLQNYAENTANQSNPSEHAVHLRRSSAALYIAVAVTGGVVYFRLVKGWKIADMLYVTRSGLKKSIAQVTEGAGQFSQNARERRVCSATLVQACLSQQAGSLFL